MDGVDAIMTSSDGALDLVARLVSEVVQYDPSAGRSSAAEVLAELKRGAPPALAFGIRSGEALPRDLWLRLEEVAASSHPPEPVRPDVLSDYRVAAEYLKRDLSATLSWSPSIDVTINGAGGFASMPGRGFSLGWGKSLPDRIVRMADHLQEEVILSRRVVWPRCPLPGHDHPLHAARRGSLAAWECELSQDVVAEIGSLSTTSA